MKKILYALSICLTAAGAVQAAVNIALDYNDGDTINTNVTKIVAGDYWIQDPGTITIDDGGLFEFTNGYRFRVGVANTSTLIIDGGTFNYATSAGQATLIGNGNGASGTLDLRAGNFSLNSSPIYIGRDRSTGVFSIRGGTASLSEAPIFDDVLGNGSIDFADKIGGGDSDGTLTITGADEAYYQGLYSAGDLTFNGINAYVFSDVFVVSGDTLSVEFSASGPAAAISASTTDGPAPLEVVFDGSGSTSGTNITSYSWDFGDGKSDLGMIVTNTYAVAGDYTAELVVTDANGLTATSTVAITATNFITAAISVSAASGQAPLEVVFDGASSTSSTNISSYAWDFGDGNFGNGMIVTNTYAAIGDYTAELVVEDENGLMDTNTVAISVNNYINVDLVVTAEGFAISNAPTFYTNDLAQTEYLSSSATGSLDTDPEQLLNGLIGDTDGGVNVPGETTYNSGSSITVNLDVSVNTLGYDITEISTIAGWGTTDGGRANQGYEILLTFVDDTQRVLAGPEHWAPNVDPTTYWTKVTFVETNGLALATGVKAVTFNISNDANAGGSTGAVVGREFDIVGVASVPLEPTAVTLAFTNGVSALTWETDGEFMYSIQRVSGLVYGTWATFTNVVGTPPRTTVDLPAEEQDATFYRVIAE